MPEGENEYAEIENISEEECRDRWQGIDWQPGAANPDLGICISDYDFDAWIAENEKQERNNEKH